MLVPWARSRPRRRIGKRDVKNPLSTESRRVLGSACREALVSAASTRRAALAGIGAVLARSVFGKNTSPRTAVEAAAGIRIANPVYPPGDVRRYCVADGATDDAAALNALLGNPTFVATYEIVIPRGVDVLVNSQLVCVSGLHLRLDGTITRNWTTRTVDIRTQATLRSKNALSNADFVINTSQLTPKFDRNINITGTGEIRQSTASIAAVRGDPNYDTGRVTATRGGPHLYLVADDVYLGPITLRGPCGYWALIPWGARWEFAGLKTRGQVAVFEDGIHFQGCDDVSGFVDVESGDDAIAFGGYFNIGCRNVRLRAVVLAHKGAAVAFINERIGPSAAFGPITEYVQDIHVDVTGRAGQTRNACVKVRTDIVHSDFGTVRNCSVQMDLTHGTARSHNGVNPQGVLCIGGKGLTFSGRIRHPVGSVVDVRNGTNIHLDLDCDAPQIPLAYFAYLKDSKDCVLAGTYSCSAQGGVLVDDSTVEIPATILGVPDARSAVRIVSGGSPSVHLCGKVVRAIGARGTFAIRNEAETADISVDGSGSDLSGVDGVLQQAVAPAHYRRGHGNGLRQKS